MNLKEFKQYLESATTSKDLNDLSSHESLDITSNDGFLMTIEDVYTEKHIITDEPHYKDWGLDIEIGDDCYLSTRFDEEVEVTQDMLIVVEKWLNDRT